ncbi:MAG: hypothetical protein ACYDAG_06200 [Chloroflexota bacterium]
MIGIHPGGSGRRSIDYSYAAVFLLCIAVCVLTFSLFIRQGWGVVQLPTIHLPNLRFLTTALHS